MNYLNSKDYKRLLNLLRFNVNFSSFADCELYDQSPSYIVEKFEFHTGLQSCEFAKTSERLLYTPDSLENFIHIYCKRWGRVETDVLRHIIYLKTCENLHLLRMVENFEILYGPIKLIKCEESYLHAKIEADFLPTILDINEKNLKVIIRDWNIENIL